MNLHPDELELATLDELPMLRRMAVRRHVRNCEACERQVAGYAALRGELHALPEPEVDWESLSREMRANIRLGLEAGECVREARAKRFVSPGLIVAFASLLVLLTAGVVLQRVPGNAGGRTVARQMTAPTSEYRAPVLETSAEGIELRTGPASFGFLNREADASRLTSVVVSAQGSVRSHDIDDAGAVTIRDVYLQ